MDVMDKRKSLPKGFTLEEYVKSILNRMPTGHLTYRETYALKKYLLQLEEKNGREMSL